MKRKPSQEAIRRALPGRVEELHLTPAGIDSLDVTAVIGMRMGNHTAAISRMDSFARKAVANGELAHGIHAVAHEDSEPVRLSALWRLKSSMWL
jgi:hypothetical protein